MNVLSITALLWVVASPAVVQAATAVPSATTAPNPGATSPESSAAMPATSPSPAASSALTPRAEAMKPTGFHYRGYVRAYDFLRDNTSSNHQGGALTAVDQGSFNLGGGVHLEDNFYRGLTAGVGAFYAYPFDDHCSLRSAHYIGSPCVTQKIPALRPDDTLPGYRLSALDETYLAYGDRALSVVVGDQLFASPWANPGDSRLKPAAFQGIDAKYTINRQFDVEVADMIRFQNRTSGAFDCSTLLTSFTPVTGLGGSISVPVNLYDPDFQTLDSPGFFYGRIGYAYGKNRRFVANVSDYNYSEIANAGWADLRYQIAPSSPIKPYAALQGGFERNIGTALVGKINSSVVGGQLGGTITTGLTLAASYDYTPLRTDREVDISNTGLACSAAGHTIGLAKGYATAIASVPYFLPSGGTANCTANSDGTVDIYYGGWASPYTFSYANDPLFTTSLTQGMADRGSPGSAYKAQLTYTTLDKHITVYGTFAEYHYSNPGYAQRTGEADLDLSYFPLKAPAKGPYRGPSFRYRYGDRYQSGTPSYGGTPDFRYNRIQLQYDF